MGIIPDPRSVFFSPSDDGQTHAAELQTHPPGQLEWPQAHVHRRPARGLDRPTRLSQLLRLSDHTLRLSDRKLRMSELWVAVSS